MKHLLVIVIFCFNILFSFSQITPEGKLGLWYDLGGNHRISEKISINTYAQLWLYEVNDNFNFLLLKTGLSYHINSKLTTTISYDYSDYNGSMNTNSTHTFENRISEQITYKHKFIKTLIDHRFRTEHRFLRKQNSNPSIVRLRYRFGTKFKLNKTLFIRLYNELLLTQKLSKTPENRFYSALGINISKSNTIQLGYLNRNTIKGDNLHRLQIGVFFNTNHIKKLPK